MAKAKNAQQEIFTSEIKRVVLFVLFVPSADRKGIALANQDEWVRKAVKTFSKQFGGATAMPPCRGGWVDPATDQLIEEFPVLVHSYAEEKSVHSLAAMQAVSELCRELGRGTKQGEVAIVIDDVMHSFRFD